MEEVGRNYCGFDGCQHWHIASYPGGFDEFQNYWNDHYRDRHPGVDRGGRWADGVVGNPDEGEPALVHKTTGANKAWWVDTPSGGRRTFGNQRDAMAFAVSLGLAYEISPRSGTGTPPGELEKSTGSWAAARRQERAVKEAQVERADANRLQLLEARRRADEARLAIQRETARRVAATQKKAKPIEDMSYRLRMAERFGWNVRIDMADGGTWAIWRPTRKGADNAGYRRLMREVERVKRSEEAKRVREMTYGELRGLVKNDDNGRAEMDEWDQKFKGQADA